MATAIIGPLYPIPGNRSFDENSTVCPHPQPRAASKKAEYDARCTDIKSMTDGAWSIWQGKAEPSGDDRLGGEQ